jgi:alpha-N-acetylglucosaminidase
VIRRQFNRWLLGSAAFAPFSLHAREVEGFPAAEALVRRLIGNVPVRCEKIAGEVDAWTLDRDGDTLVLRGTSPVAIAAALNDWLRHNAKRQLSWTGEYLDLPAKLPLPDKPRSAKASLTHRVAYNFCTYGYTMAWWDWAQWERELDFLALQGVNMPLALVGHECVWRAAMTRIGMSDEAVRSFLSGPNFLPWQFMANIESWAGPMPESWLESHLDLGRKIFARMRELGMTPIVPGFTGYVPVALKELKPDAKILLKRSWFGFPGTAQLDPSDPLFAEISGVFVEENRRLFGEAHWYACDLFHESKPPTNDPAYLASVGKTLIGALTKADPQAKIAMQTWTLYEPIVKAIPQDRLLLLDLDGRRKDYWGYRYVSGVIHNFGGRVYLGGNLTKSLDFDRHATRDDFKNCQGLGVFCEGSRANSPIYMAAFEGTFRAPGAAQDPAAWLRTWAQSRFGVNEGPAIDAWASTVDHVYDARSGASYQSGETPFCMRPTLHGKASSPSAGSFSRSYALPKLWAAWKLLAQDAGRLGKLDTYRYDLVDWGRQALADLGVMLHRDLREAYTRGDAAAFKKTADVFMELGRDLDRLLGTRREFRLGTWLADARRWGKNDAEKRSLERSARMLVTLWGPNTQVQVNFDYSNRQWHGLLGSFYLGRWEKYFAFLGGELAKPAGERIDDAKLLKVYGRPGPDDHPFFKELAAWEWSWADTCVGSFTPEPEGDPLALSVELVRKYEGLVEKSVSPLRQTSLPDDSYFLGDWISGSLTTTWQKKKWSLEGKLSEGGKFRVTFRYVAGRNRCDVRQVNLLHKGRVISTDVHGGRTGNEHSGNVWNLEFPDVTQAEGLELEAEIRSDGGSDSSGVIFAERQP